MTSDEQYDATCRRLRSSRLEIFELAHVLKGDRPLHRNETGFPRSRLMRALTGERSRQVLGRAAFALAISRPRTVWRLAGVAPWLCPVILRFLARSVLRHRKPVSI